MVLAEQVNANPAEYTALIHVKEDPPDYSESKEDTNGKLRTRLLKRIPLKRLMDLKIDYAFKQFFGNEKNKDITVIFLNAILQKTGRNKIKDISFRNTDLANEYADDKASRLDLLVVTDANEWIDVEIQFANKYDMVKRTIFYWSRAYQQPLEKSMSYSQLRPVIAINILNFDLFNETEHFHTSYHLYEDEDKFKLTDVMEFHFIEMGKLISDWKRDKLNPRDDILARWLLVLGMVDRRKGKDYEDIYLELEEISMEDESLRSAFQNWEELSMTQEQRIAYEARFKRIMDEEAFRRNMEIKQQEIDRSRREMDRSKQEIDRSRREMDRSKQEIDRSRQEIGRSKQELGQKKKLLEEREKKLKHKEKEAEKRGKEKVARKLLIKGMEIEFVAESTGLSGDSVIDIQRNLEIK